MGEFSLKGLGLDSQIVRLDTEDDKPGAYIMMCPDGSVFKALECRTKNDG